MRAELSDAIYEGTLPIMCLFLSGAGYEIKKIEKLLLKKDGTVENLGTKKIRSDAVQITAKDEQGKPIKISYFKTNIANGYIKKSGFLKYLEGLPKGISYVKAASYLMHKIIFQKSDLIFFLVHQLLFKMIRVFPSDFFQQSMEC